MLDKSHKFYKRTFKNSIEPLMVMLVNKKATMSPAEWKQLVDKTELIIIRNPSEFLGGNLPDKNIISETIHLVFSDFLKDTERHRAYAEKTKS